MTFEALAAEIGFALPLRWQYEGCATEVGTLVPDGLVEYASGSNYTKAALHIPVAVGVSLETLVQRSLLEELEHVKILSNKGVEYFEKASRELRYPPSLIPSRMHGDT